ncbi:hypothetical protein [Cupriavidus sp. UME77]|uniref:hypothetical protein n=1 Tax=Cupriavidus sp. UME77 TaxID=1862321 RepID=UPI00160345A5|nr:hypothetical protein [Cupriavidus sp. UME77]
MIDLNFGSIIFDDGLNISNRTTIAQLERLALPVLSPAVKLRTQLSIGTHACKNLTWGVGAVFSQERLVQVWLQCLNVDGVNAGAWDLENEKMRRDFHDKLIEELCCSICPSERAPASLAYKFPWGKISSIIDMRGVQSLIVIDYF